MLPSAIAVGTDNQVLLGNTGAASAFGALTDASVPDAITINDPDGSVTTSNGVFNGEATVDGKYAVVGGDATTGLMIQAASITSSAATLQTNAFVTAFGATPVATVAYTEDPGGAEAPWIVAITTTNIIVTVVADKNYSYIAVGARP